MCPREVKPHVLQYNAPVIKSLPRLIEDQACSESSNHTRCFPFNICWSQAERTELAWTDLPLYLHVPSHRVGWDRWMWACASGREERCLWRTVPKSTPNSTGATAPRGKRGIEAPDAGPSCNIITEHNQSEPLPRQKQAYLAIQEHFLFVRDSNPLWNHATEQEIIPHAQELWKQRAPFGPVTQVFQRKNLRHCHGHTI